MSKKYIPLLITLLAISCSEKKPKTEIQSVQTKEISDATADYVVAVEFINDYVRNENLMRDAVEMQKWLNESKVITSSFKSEYNRIIDEAYKNDPELGLDFNPIFDAQDYPEEGFEFVSYDSKKNVVTVAGKTWKDFQLNLKIVNQDNRWLVDGAGVVNIPSELRIKR